MQKDYKKLLPIMFIILSAFAGSYFAFARYKPTLHQDIQEVKGASTSHDFDLPMPIGSEKLGSSKTLNSSQTTFLTKKSADEVLKFYQNVFSDKHWVPESESVNNGIYITTYKEMDNLATITVTKQQEDERTIVSLKISKL
jgi:hypothetical protein